MKASKTSEADVAGSLHVRSFKTGYSPGFSQLNLHVVARVSCAGLGIWAETGASSLLRFADLISLQELNLREGGEQGLNEF